MLFYLWTAKHAEHAMTSPQIVPGSTRAKRSATFNSDAVQIFGPVDDNGRVATLTGQARAAPRDRTGAENCRRICSEDHHGYKTRPRRDAQNQSPY